MSEEMIPDVIASDVPEAVEHLMAEAEELTVNYSEKNLAELVQLFEALVADEERMKKSKDAEILKAGHHGSDTSNSEEFLDAISPNYALISCGIGNKYEHPIKEIMERLEERNIDVYRTDESGTVIMTITSNNVSFNCEPGDYLSGVELEERESK